MDTLRGNSIKIVLVALLFGGLFLFQNPPFLGAVPKEEQLKVTPDKIVGSKTEIDERGIEVTKYKYVSNRPVQAVTDEVVSLRTEMSVTFQKDGKLKTLFTEYDKWKVGNEWYELDVATTTPEAYRKQTWRLIPYTYALTDTFSATGTWTSAADVCSPIGIEVWAGGEAGTDATFDNGGIGGGAGAYSEETAFAVSPSTGYTVTVGAGGTSNGANGGDSWFNSTGTVLAKGGGTVTAGTGGATSGGVGDTKFAGGNGAPANGVSTNAGGGGGGGAGDAATGGNASNRTGGTGGTASGGNGGQGGSGLGTNGAAGSTMGGGGGGGGSDGGGTAGVGGAGARGQVIVTYTNGCGGTSPVIRQNIFNLD